jgi:glutamate mutase epsilon subunit
VPALTISAPPLNPIVIARDQECIERRRAKINQRGVVSAAPAHQRNGQIIPLRCSRGQLRANDAGAQVLQFGSFSEDQQALQLSEQRCQSAPAGCRSAST